MEINKETLDKIKALDEEQLRAAIGDIADALGATPAAEKAGAEQFRDDQKEDPVGKRQGASASARKDDARTAGRDSKKAEAVNRRGRVRILDGNISEMLKSVLDDPGAMKKLMGVAENLMGSGGTQEKPDCPPPSPPPPPPPERCRPGTDERIALIAALRPYLSEERRQTADGLIKMLKMLRLADIDKLMKGKGAE